MSCVRYDRRRRSKSADWIRREFAAVQGVLSKPCYDDSMELCFAMFAVYRAQTPRMRTALVAACVWVTCRRNGVPRTMEEVSDMCACERRDVTSALRRVEAAFPELVGDAEDRANVTSMVARNVETLVDLCIIDRGSEARVKASARHVLARIDVDSGMNSMRTVLLSVIVRCAAAEGASFAKACAALEISVSCARSCSDRFKIFFSPERNASKAGVDRE
jgi:hypothetical protein